MTTTPPPSAPKFQLQVVRVVREGSGTSQQARRPRAGRRRRSGSGPTKPNSLRAGAPMGSPARSGGSCASCGGRTARQGWRATCQRQRWPASPGRASQSGSRRSLHRVGGRCALDRVRGALAGRLPRRRLRLAGRGAVGAGARRRGPRRAHPGRPGVRPRHRWPAGPDRSAPGASGRCRPCPRWVVVRCRSAAPPMDVRRWQRCGTVSGDAAASAETSSIGAACFAVSRNASLGTFCATST